MFGARILIEDMSAVSLKTVYKWCEYPLVTGIHIYKRLPEIISTILKCGSDYCWRIGIDFSWFDSAPQQWLILDAFNVLEDIPYFNDIYERMVYEYSKYHFIHWPIIMPDGRIWAK